MLEKFKMQVHVGCTKVTLKFIVGNILAAFANIGTDFCDQDLEAIHPKQRLVELESSDCIPFLRKPQERIKWQLLLDSLTYPKENTRLSSIVRFEKETILPAHSRTWVIVKSPWNSSAALQPKISLCKECLAAEANGDL